MSAPKPVSSPTALSAPPGTRLHDLVARYLALKSDDDKRADELKALTTAIKLEMTFAAPGASEIIVRHPDFGGALKLTGSPVWDLDEKALKRGDPFTYSKYARQVTRWTLRRVTG